MVRLWQVRERFPGLDHRKGGSAMRFLTITRNDGSTAYGRLLGAGNGSDQGLDLILRDEITDETTVVNTMDIRSLKYDADLCSECLAFLSYEEFANETAVRYGTGYAHADCAQSRDLDTRERAHDDVLAAMDAGH